jgi:hypothetical protein
MIQINKFKIAVVAMAMITLASCKKKDDEVIVTPPPVDTFDVSGTFTQVDQMARPAVNTVFVGAARKNEFNTTTPSSMNAAFKTDFVNVLTAFGQTMTSTNALGQTRDQLATLLVSDVLNVKMNGTTTFFDGTNVLTGRALADDVIDVELLLIFGGSAGTSNPGLTKDNVGANDKAFLSTFPYLASPF